MSAGARKTSQAQREEQRLVREGSIEEIAEFYDNTDTGDFDWTPTENITVGRPEMEQISVRLAKEDVEALKRRAKRSGVGYTTILRMIVHEHVNSPLNG
jgi:predicted DNA binding CopG/RHH family protein